MGSSQPSIQVHSDIILRPSSTTPPPVLDTIGSAMASPPPQQHLTIADLRSVATHIKDTLAAAISELRLEVRSLHDRVARMETAVGDHDIVLQRTTRKVDDHMLQLREINRHLKDLDNRGRRHNLRVRGLPKSVEGDLVVQSVTGIFNSVLDRPPQTPISMNRIHCALRPRGRETDSPETWSAVLQTTS